MYACVSVPLRAYVVCVCVFVRMCVSQHATYLHRSACEYPPQSNAVIPGIDSRAAIASAATGGVRKLSVLRTSHLFSALSASSSTRCTSNLCSAATQERLSADFVACVRRLCGCVW